MSLQVWLPFVKDTTQQGLSSTSITASGSGVSLNTNGKLGNCYYFDGTTNGYMTTNFSTNIGTSDFSIALWVKIPTITSGTYFTICSSKGQSGASAGLGIYWNYSQKKFLWSTSDGTATEIWQADTVDTIVYDKWIHLVMVRESADAKHGYFYINGIRYELASVPAIRNITASTSTLYLGKISNGAYPLKMYLNDFRFYDHALSAKEVKEIAKGLVCHYTLGDRSIQQMNNCYSYPTFNTSSASGGWSHWGGSGHIGTYGQNTDKTFIYNKSNTYSHWVANGSGATYNYLVYQSPAFEGGTRSLCCIIKHENGLPITNSICYPTWNARSGGTPINAWTSIISLSNGFYLCKCENIQQDGSNDLVGVYVTAGNKIYISEGYLENDRVCCSDIFYNDTTVYDSSGYNYHMTAYGSPTISTNTVRNSVSTHFINGQYVLAQSNSNVYLPKDAITVNLWMNCSTWGNPISCTEGGGWNFESASAGIQFPCYISGVGYKTANSGVAASTLLNAWHMLTGVFDGTSVKIYIDAELKATTATGSTNGIGYAANRLVISGEAGSSTPASSTFVGEISDVRIYATALSSEDIKALYQVGASIDKLGNMYAYEFNEV